MKIGKNIDISFRRQGKRNETSIEKEVFEHAQGKGCLTPKLSTPGQRYWPDRAIFCPHGYMFFIEFKTLTGRLSGGQERRIKKLRDLGYIVYVVDNVDTGKMRVDQELAKLECVYSVVNPDKS